MPRRIKADLILVLVSFVWGSTFVLVKQALDDASTLVFLTLRFLVGGLALLLFAGPLPRRAVPAGMMVGTFLFLGYFLQTQGLHWTTASKSAFITGLYVVLVPVFGSLVTRRFPGRGVAAGAGMSLAGLALLTNWGPAASINQGDVWTLGCTVAFAVHILLVEHFSRQFTARALATGQVLAAAALSGASFPWAEKFFLRPTPRVWTAVLVTGVLCTAMAFFAQAWAQQFTPATHTALIFSLEPAFAWLTSAVVLGERMGGLAALGALLILGGILVAELSAPLKT